MASENEHEGHKEPTLFATAFPIWLAAIPALWIFIANFGYAPSAFIAFAIWGAIVFGVSNSFDCRNATKMSGWDGAKALAIIVFPYGVLTWYAVNADTFTQSLGDVGSALAV